jgi:hypothetical protein
MARQFKDEAGREWSLFVGVAQLRKVREQTGFDGAGLLLHETFKQLGDPILLVDVLFVLLESQVNAKQLTPEQFAEGFAGDAIERALDSLVMAVADFLPSTQRAAIAVLWGQRTAAMELVNEKINSLAQGRSGSSSQNLKDSPASQLKTERSAKSSKRSKQSKPK